MCTRHPIGERAHRVLVSEVLSLSGVGSLRKNTQLGRIPAAFAAGAQASISSKMNLAKSCGDPTFGSKSSFFIAAFISGVAKPTLISLLSLLTMLAGVPAGAQNPVQSPRVSR